MAADPITAATANSLLQYDTTDDEDPFNDSSAKATRDDKATLSPRHAKRKADDDEDGGANLGLDEQVKIKKQRKPIVKLDEARLLSARGIPKLRELARSGKISKKLRLKGKNHEFSDMARLLNYYQLWLDNLYPRAKFADGLQLIEKVGHSKRMQVMRREWIDEGKPGYLKKKTSTERDEFDDFDDLYAGDNTVTGANREPSDTVAPAVDAEDNSLFIADSTTNRTKTTTDDLPEDDELEALLAEQETRPAPSRPQAPTDIESEGEDDLDALLAEEATRRPQAPASSRAQPAPAKSQSNPLVDEEEDELDALLAEHEAEIQSKTATQIQPASSSKTNAQSKASVLKQPSRIFDDDGDEEDDDMDDLDALLAEQEINRNNLTRPQRSTTPAEVSQHATADDHAEGPPKETDDTPIDAFADEDEDELALPHVPVAESGKAKNDSQKTNEVEEFDAQGMFSSSPVQHDG